VEFSREAPGTRIRAEEAALPTDDKLLDMFSDYLDRMLKEKGKFSEAIEKMIEEKMKEHR
jgi:hypothetical protein